MKYFGTVILIFCNLIVFSQNTLKARVIDEETKEPLIGASAIVKGTTLGTTTDTNGYLEIKNIPDGKQEIEFRYIGYKTKNEEITFPLKSDETFEINLKPEETNLDEIVVTATRSSRSIKDIPTRIETIVAGELE
jgi:outer membrane receptor for ferrienterochelin and colicins